MVLLIAYVKITLFHNATYSLKATAKHVVWSHKVNSNLEVNLYDRLTSKVKL